MRWERVNENAAGLTPTTGPAPDFTGDLVERAEIVEIARGLLDLSIGYIREIPVLIDRRHRVAYRADLGVIYRQPSTGLKFLVV